MPYATRQLPTRRDNWYPYWSRLPTTLLSSWSSLSWWSFIRGWLLSCLSLPYPSFWSFGSWSFHYSNYRSNSWFHWVSHSTTTVRVCTCLSNALDEFPVSWLVVAINRVRTIQLFVFETVIWLITRFPQTAPTDDVMKSLVSCRLQVASIGTCK